MGSTAAWRVTFLAKTHQEVPHAILPLWASSKGMESGLHRGHLSLALPVCLFPPLAATPRFQDVFPYKVGNKQDCSVPDCSRSASPGDSSAFTFSFFPPDFGSTAKKQIQVKPQHGTGMEDIGGWGGSL